MLLRLVILLVWSAGEPTHEADGGITYEVDPDFLEHVRREACEQGELPGDD